MNKLRKVLRLKPVATIQEWSLIQINNHHVLVGHISDHPRQKEFHKDMQMTSTLVRIDFRSHVAETLNTLYRLK